MYMYGTDRQTPKDQEIKTERSMQLLNSKLIGDSFWQLLRRDATPVSSTGKLTADMLKIETP